MAQKSPDAVGAALGAYLLGLLACAEKVAGHPEIYTATDALSSSEEVGVDRDVNCEGATSPVYARFYATLCLTQVVKFWSRVFSWDASKAFSVVRATLFVPLGLSKGIVGGGVGVASSLAYAAYFGRKHLGGIQGVVNGCQLVSRKIREGLMGRVEEMLVCWCSKFNSVIFAGST